MTIREQQDRAQREEFVTVAELALLLRLAPQTVWRKVRSGKMPGVVRFGRSIRLHRHTVLSWAKASTYADGDRSRVA